MKCRNCGAPFANSDTGLCPWCETRGSIPAPIIKQGFLKSSVHIYL